MALCSMGTVNRPCWLPSPGKVLGEVYDDGNQLLYQVGSVKMRLVGDSTYAANATYNSKAKANKVKEVK